MSLNIERVKKNRPKHQHWVPQFYLRYYATPESRGTKQPQVWIFSKEESDGHEKLTNIRNICGQRYMYSPLLDTGERDWALDDLISDLESGFSTLWPMLAGDYVALADPDIRKGLALFLSVTYLRNPDIRKQVERLHAGIVGFLDKGAKLDDGTPDVAGLEINGKYHPLATDGWSRYQAWGKMEHDRFFANSIRANATWLAERLMEKRWSIIFADRDTFITTDKPIGLQHQTREVFGIGTPGTMITFPISPTRVLMLDDMHSEPVNQYYPLKEGNGAAVNLTLWNSAQRFLITSRPVADVLEEMVSFGLGNEGSDNGGRST